MEKQSKIFPIEENEDIKPEIKVIRNTYSMASGLVKEEITIKRWILLNNRIIRSNLAR